MSKSRKPAQGRENRQTKKVAPHGEEYTHTLQRNRADLRPTLMRRTAWIWLAGCLAWALDCVVNGLRGDRPHAELALLLAVLFGIAYAFYRRQPR